MEDIQTKLNQLTIAKKTLKVVSESVLRGSPSKRGTPKKKVNRDSAINPTNATEHHVKISHDTMIKLGIGTGQICLLHLDCPSIVVVPVFAWRGQIPNDSILLDGMLISQLSSILGDSVKTVEIEKLLAPLRDADSVSVDLEDDILAEELIHAIILGSIVTKNRVISIPVYGKQRKLTIKEISCKDCSTEPAAVMIGPHTTVKSMNHVPTSQTTSTLRRAKFSEIGGLKEQIEQIREMVELPLTNPELFTDHAIRPPRGVLLYGPPGTGKTLLARAVAEECSANVFSISGGRFQSSGEGSVVGALENKIRTIFDQARENAPSIVVIDEVDAIAPQRDEVTSESERRAVSTLLSILDGAVPLNGVSIVATTNRPEAVDPALRRPGRLDMEIEIGVPTASARLEIFQCHLAKVSHNISDECLDSVAAKCHGYVGADIELVVHEASLASLRRSSGSHKSSIITNDDLEHGVARTRPSAMREIILDIPRVKWEEIGGQKDIKQKLREAVEWPLKYGETFARIGVRPPRGILLYGPPGCSKTMLAKALATESGLNFVAIKGPELFSKWVGESERAVKKVFSRARAVAPSVVFLDEIDALGSTRSGGSSVQDRVLSQLLSEMDGITGLKGVVVVGATNRPDMIDAALMRPGRFDRILYVGLPDASARDEIFTLGLSKIKLVQNMDKQSLSAWLAGETEGYSGAECMAVCRDAVMQALSALPLPSRNSESEFAFDGATRDHFVSSLRKIKPRITKETLKFYQEFQSSHNSLEV